MVQVKFCLLLAALCACCGLGSSGVTTPKVEIIDVSKTSKTPVEAQTTLEPVKPETIATTEAPGPVTTTAKTPVPDPATPPTTAAPLPTTQPPTTQPPTTPPTPAPAPTPAPGPLPPPEQHTWSYHNNTSNVTCIVVQFAAQLNVTYTKTVENVTSLAYVILNVPVNASVAGGSCDANEQLLTLSWPTRSSALNNTMTLTYAKNDTLKSYGLTSLELQLSPELFVNASFTSVVTLKHGAAWQTPLTTSYRCMPATRLNMTGDADSGAAASLTFSKLQEEAFRTVDGTGFSSARECGGDVPDAVPIAVGCALGGLVLVVLVAYLVARRRSDARGYLSM